MIDWTSISQHIRQATGQDFSVTQQRSVGGGCINQAYRIGDGTRQYFVKLNRPDLGDMFAAEAAGLIEIHASQSILAPAVICHGDNDSHAYLVLEHIQFGQQGNPARFGQDLAAMHRYQHEHFGWHRDNTIGATPQYNRQHSHWTDFWLEQRLQPQLQLAARQGYGGTLQTLGEQLCLALPGLLDSHHPIASLLHGDLWSGNYGYNSEGRAIIFDAAVYFGDRETDLAMTELFGGFPPEFYQAYNEAFPLEPGYAQRKILYNLYHILNHLNLFGGGYLSQAEDMMRELLAHVR